MKKILGLLALFVFAGCTPQLSNENPIEKEISLFSTELEGEETVPLDTDTEIVTGRFKQVELLGARLAPYASALVQQRNDDESWSLAVSSSRGTEIIEGDRNIYHAILDGQTPLYLSSAKENSKDISYNVGSEQPLDGEIEGVVELSNESIVLVEKKSDETRRIWMNDEVIWETDQEVVDIEYIPYTKSIAAIVQNNDKRSFTVLDDGVTIGQNYKNVLAFNKNNQHGLSFIFRTWVEPKSWKWFINGKVISVEGDWREIRDYDYNDGVLYILASLVNAEDEEVRDWYLISSKGEKTRLPEGNPTALIPTDKGYKTVLEKENSYSILDIGSGTEQKTWPVMSPILIKNGEDIWYSYRKTKEFPLISIARGDYTIGDFVSFKAPILINNREYIIAEKSDGQVVLLQVNP